MLPFAQGVRFTHLVSADFTIHSSFPLQVVTGSEMITIFHISVFIQLATWNTAE